MQNAGPVRLRQVRDFEQTIGDAFSLMRQNGPLLVKSIVLFSAIPMLLYGAANALMTNNIAVQDPYSEPTEVFGRLAGMMGWLLLVGVAYLFAQVFCIAAVLEFVRAYMRDEHHGLTVGDLWRRSIAEFWTYLGIMFIAGLAWIVGLMFCVLPGIYLKTAFVLAGVVHAVERSGAGDGLGKSMKMANSEFWPLLGLCVVLFLIEYVFSLLTNLPAMLVSGLDQMIPGLGSGVPADMGPAKSALFAVLTAVGSLFTVVLHGVLVLAIALRYFSIVEKREGTGMREQLSGLDQ